MVYTDGYHLVADSVDELHQFADKLYLRRSWFKDYANHPHYEIWGNKLNRAKKLGVKVIDFFELYEKAIKLGLEEQNPIILRLKQLDEVLWQDGYRKNSLPRKMVDDLKNDIKSDHVHK